jgi:hypothetical protein
MSLAVAADGTVVHGKSATLRLNPRPSASGDGRNTPSPRSHLQLGCGACIRPERQSDTLCACGVGLGGRGGTRTWT